VLVHELLLLQVFLDLLGFSHEEGDVPIRGVGEAREHTNGLFEFGDEFHVLLIAPGLAEIVQAGVEHADLSDERVVEAFEVLRETPEFTGIDNSLGHRWPFRKKRFDEL
jgi:hypothetical protein